MSKKLLLYLNVLAIITLLGTFYLSKLPPDTFRYGSFLGFGFPYLVLINVGFILIWLFSARYFAVLSFAALFLAAEGVLKSFSLPLKQEKGDLNIMTYNVKNFDLYNWSKNKESRAKMLEIIENENPDILCFQEFFTHENDELDNIKKIHQEFGYPYFHYEETAKSQKNHWGAATFSKYPIVNKGKIYFEDGDKNISIYTDIKVKEEVVRVYNLHLTSFHMVDEDYEYLRSLSDLKIPTNGSFRTIMGKLRKGFNKRSNQADILADHIQHFSGYKIVCGDFNDIPQSYTYQKISSEMKDAFIMRGIGMGKTFVSSLPSLRIDYVLVTPEIEVQEYRRLPYKYSDHYPVMVSFSF